MPRLFTALEVPSAVAQDLWLLRGGLSGARWIDADNFHITLRFIGDIDEAAAHDVFDALFRVRRPPFDVTLNGLSVFGGDKPRALVAKIAPTEPLSELQAEHERLMRRIGLPPEARRYVPHVTLARLRAVSPLSIAAYIESHGYFASRTFRAERFVLFSARDSVGGGPYIVEAEYPLQ